MSENYKAKGILHHIGDEQTFASGFVKREFVIRVPDEKNSDYDQFVLFELFKERIDQIEPFNAGDEIEVQFNIKGREWEGRYFTNLNAWKVDRIGEAKSAPKQEAAASSGADAAEKSGEDNSEIPF